MTNHKQVWLMGECLSLDSILERVKNQTLLESSFVVLYDK